MNQSSATWIRLTDSPTLSPIPHSLSTRLMLPASLILFTTCEHGNVTLTTAWNFFTPFGYTTDNMQPWNVFKLAVVISIAAKFKRQYHLLLSNLQHLCCPLVWTQQVRSSICLLANSAHVDT